MVVRCNENFEHFCSSFEQSLSFRIVNFLDIVSQVLDRLG